MNRTPLTLLSPAKLNLFLHITGRRADGYHNLQTLFQLLDYGDTLHFTPRPDNTITLEPSLPGVAAEHNLILRAARQLQPLATGAPGVDIRLEKRLPLGGGLGGGSSNAATALVALNHLWQCGQSTRQLQALGLSLGADVPVFVQGRSAWAEGVGEQLSPLSLPDRWYLVLTPDCRVSTAEIFAHKDLTRGTPDITVAAFLEQGGRNDCQNLVRRLYPAVDEALDWLCKTAGNARLTGTGASVFASFDSAEAAHRILAKAPSHLPGFTARGIDSSPVHRLLEQPPGH